MDIRLFARVLWRFKLVVAIGLLLAVALSVLSVARINAHGISYRQAVLWQSTARVGVTNSRFDWGRLNTDDLGRTNELTTLYAELVTSDPVRQLMRRDGPVHGQVIATAVTTGWSGSISLPFIDITGIATSPTEAASLASRAAGALSTYLEQEEVANNVAPSDRVVLQTLASPSARTATVFKARSKTIPILVFAVVLLATTGIAFLLENLRPRAALLRDPELAQEREQLIRRTA